MSLMPDDWWRTSWKHIKNLRIVSHSFSSCVSLAKACRICILCDSESLEQRVNLQLYYLSAHKPVRSFHCFTLIAVIDSHTKWSKTNHGRIDASSLYFSCIFILLRFICLINWITMSELVYLFYTTQTPNVCTLHKLLSMNEWMNRFDKLVHCVCECVVGMVYT